MGLKPGILFNCGKKIKKLKTPFSPFLHNFLVLYPLKTTEFLLFSGGNEMEALAAVDELFECV